jgi:hypothetical protein
MVRRNGPSPCRTGYNYNGGWRSGSGSQPFQKLIEDNERIFGQMAETSPLPYGPGGAMETILKAKQDGKIHYIGFSAHSEEAALAAMDKFEFDSILFPLSFPIWIKAKFGPAVNDHEQKIIAKIVPVMVPDDLKKAGPAIEQAVKKYG